MNTIQCEVINSVRYQLSVKHGKSRVTKRNKTALAQGSTVSMSRSQTVIAMCRGHLR